VFIIPVGFECWKDCEGGWCIGGPNFIVQLCNMTEKQKQLIESLKDYYNQHEFISKLKFPRSTTINRHFGSWNKALSQAGIPTRERVTERVELACKKCGASFTRPQSGVQQNNFCNKSCAASYNNRVQKRKNKPKQECEGCKADVNIGIQFCKQCIIDRRDVPISELFYEGNRASKYAKIRHRARKSYLKEKPYECAVCGYKLHIEVAHLKAISKFEPHTLLSVVNNLSNLVGLCKRCHWELDNGHLKLEPNEIEK